MVRGKVATRLLLLGLAVVGIGGCATVDLDKLIAHLEQRQVTSCIYLNGAYGPFVALQTVTATGGASLAECRRHP